MRCSPCNFGYELRGSVCVRGSNIGKSCWEGCHEKSGTCDDFCGVGIKCCRKFHPWHANIDGGNCRAMEGADLQHQCVGESPPKNVSALLLAPHAVFDCLERNFGWLRLRSFSRGDCEHQIRQGAKCDDSDKGLAMKDCCAGTCARVARVKAEFKNACRLDEHQCKDKRRKHVFNEKLACIFNEKQNKCYPKVEPYNANQVEECLERYHPSELLNDWLELHCEYQARYCGTKYDYAVRSCCPGFCGAKHRGTPLLSVK